MSCTDSRVENSSMMVVNSFPLDETRQTVVAFDLEAKTPPDFWAYSPVKRCIFVKNTENSINIFDGNPYSEAYTQKIGALRCGGQC